MDMVDDEIRDEPDPLSLKEVRSPNRARSQWTPEERVEFYLSCAYSVARIKRETGFSDEMLRDIVQRVDEKKIKEVAEGDESARAWQIGYLQECAAEAMDAYYDKWVTKGKRDLRPLRAGREFLKDIRAIRGLDAPKNVNHHLDDKPLIAPGDQQAFINSDPAIRAQLMKLNEERRALMAKALRPAGGAS